MPTKNITLHYGGAEYEITHWEYQELQEMAVTADRGFFTLHPLDDNDTTLEILIGPGIPLHFVSYEGA